MEYVIIAILIILSGLFSGLNLGLLALSTEELQRKISAGFENAKPIYHVRKNGNWLLCTLLLSNVGVNVIIPLYLNEIAQGPMAAGISTGLIFFFGEVLPQAMFARYAMAICSKRSIIYFVRFLMYVTSPISYPLGKVLDYFFGGEVQTVWHRKEIQALIAEHSSSDSSDIDEDEQRLVVGSLNFSRKTAEEVMTPRINVFDVSVDEVIDLEWLKMVEEAGFSRIPVFDEERMKYVGIIFVKRLLCIEKGVLVKDVMDTSKVLEVKTTTKLDDLLALFIQKKIHLAVVFTKFQLYSGIVTLEDIMEEILRTEIMDETDVVADLRIINNDDSGENTLQEAIS